MSLYDPLVVPSRRMVSYLKPQGGQNGSWGLHRCLTMTDEVEQHGGRMGVEVSVCQRVSRVASGKSRWDGVDEMRGDE